jgi:hypothetical protein
MIRHIHHCSKPSNEQAVISEKGVKGWPSIYKAETLVIFFQAKNWI